jgi:hypothetical protein
LPSNTAEANPDAPLAMADSAHVVNGINY